MDAALFFLLVFTAYTVLLALSLFRSRNYAKQIDQLQRDVREMRAILWNQGNVMHDLSQSGMDMSHSGMDMSHSGMDLSHSGMDLSQAQELLSNPLVQQAMQQSDDEQVQELQTLLSNPLVQQAMGNKCGSRDARGYRTG